MGYRPGQCFECEHGKCDDIYLDDHGCPVKDLKAQNAKLRDRLIVMDFKRHVLHKTSRERCCDEQCMANAKLLWGDVNPSYDDMQEWYAALERNNMNRVRFNGETEKP